MRRIMRGTYLLAARRRTSEGKGRALVVVLLGHGGDEGWALWGVVVWVIGSIIGVRM